MKNYEEVLKKVVERIKPSKQEIKDIDIRVREFLKNIKKRIKKEKIDAEIFVGGSFAKKTVIKKEKYDVDIFIRYGKKHFYDDLSILTSRLLKNFKNVSRIRGSRNYFVIEQTPSFFIETIPVKKIKKPSEAENITDLSYSHVKYINKKIKSEKILDEIRIAKAFCYATKCYGAESYVRGFSGYGLELLIYYYKSFLSLAKAVIKSKERIIIDIEKEYKNKKQILLDLNSSKLSSPMILVDPTYKQRNVLAALSKETFEKFKKECEKFIKNPSLKLFEEKKQDIGKIKENAQKNKENFVCLELTTSKQKGDIAGSKLLKFFNHLKKEIKDNFKIKKESFYYGGEKKSKIFLCVKSRENKILQGPLIEDKKNTESFKKRHKKTFVKGKRICAQDDFEKDFKKFIEKWIKKNKEKIKDMSIEEIKKI
ncbi:MAG: nucleotidyltransferase domain-containing protein [archaeon]